jgi:hypothetical protein
VTDFDEILATIGKSVNRFHNKVPETQRALYREVLEALQKLDVDKGKLKTNAKNLSALNGLKNKLLKLILTPEYKESVKEYIKSFNEVTTLQNQYWKGVESNFKPPKLLQALKEVTIDDVVNKLTEAGIGVNIGDKITDILRQNITGGGSYADLTEQLRQHILTTPESAGALDKYAKQITTDAINQYNGQYTQVVTNDLGYEWFKYDNTDIETTRPFCDAMTDIKYFHISEVPAILQAQGLTYIDKKGERVQVRLYSKTGLPHGMIPGTDASNFFVRRGGYNCGHQIRPVNQTQVPKEIKDRVMVTPAYIRWGAQQVAEEKPRPQVVEVDQVQTQIVAKSQKYIDKLKQDGFNTSEELLAYVTPANNGLLYSRRSTSYNPETKTVQVSTNDSNAQASFKKRVVPHEIGHAIHFENEIITYYKVDPKFVTMRNGLKSILGNKGAEINEALNQLRKANPNIGDEMTPVADILGALTYGRYGWGHEKAYYKSKHNHGDMEIFANGVEILQNGNRFANAHPILKQVTDELTAYISAALQAIKQGR